jgi:hypothetical protein
MAEHSDNESHSPPPRRHIQGGTTAWAWPAIVVVGLRCQQNPVVATTNHVVFMGNKNMRVRATLRHDILSRIFHQVVNLAGAPMSPLPLSLATSLQRLKLAMIIAMAMDTGEFTCTKASSNYECSADRECAKFRHHLCLPSNSCFV